MTDNANVLDAVVVGAGWAGLGVSYSLARQGLRHAVLERGRIGETWRTQRWDSFRMNTPNVQTVMPGDCYDGSDPFGALTRNQFVALLEDFARRNELPVEPDTVVTELAGGHENGGYRLITSRGTLLARNVVIASGNLNCPVRPVWAAALPPGLRQIDASDYRSAADLPAGAVLVVGSGQSGPRSRKNWRKQAEQSSLPPAGSGGSRGTTEVATSCSGSSKADFSTCVETRSFDLRGAFHLVVCLG
ncbi:MULTISPECIES: NAD(P)-binding domain-containing protein [unclassified Mesorhizobium]|uniref:NAD(P)-binding domain-containing protein n=1 Tax=unclassified Mesorhizobium TaxID=325217 RepID=UPI00040028AE